MRTYVRVAVSAVILCAAISLHAEERFNRGIVAVVNIMLGLITPPYGLLLFIMTNISGEPLRKIVKETLPFLLAMIGALAFITFVPESILWLPRLFGYQGGAGLP